MSDLELSDNDEINSILDEDSDNEEISSPLAKKLNDTLPAAIFKTAIVNPDDNILDDSDEDDDPIDSDNDYKLDDDDEDDEDDDVVVGDDEDDNISTTNKESVGNIAKSALTGGAIKSKKSSTVSTVPQTDITLPMIFEKNDSDYESDTDEDEDDNYLQKFDKEQKNNYILDQHPECEIHNYNEVYNLSKVQRNKDNIIIDDLHKTVPILTKYEKTRILGLRAKQINNGAKPMVKIDDRIIDGYLIALKELETKSIPVIIRRPIPGGASEYWHLKDLEII